MEADGDVDLPDVGEVSSRVEGDSEHGVHPEGPGYREGTELGGEDGRG
jgi:hypothetical protein